MHLDPAHIVPLVIAIGFAAGINVYATVLTLGLLARFGAIPALPSGLHALSSTPVLIAAAILFSAEFFADKIPGFDVVWTAAHTFIRIPLAALLAFGATTHLPPQLQALAVLLGGAVGALAHSSKLAARLLVTPSPEPVSNIALSTAEDAGTVGLSWIAATYPLVAAGVVLVLLLISFFVLRRAARSIRALCGSVSDSFQRLFRSSAAKSPPL